MAVRKDAVKPRPGARPVPGGRLPAVFKRLERVAARTAPSGARAIADAPRTGSVEEVRARKYALLVTYRRNGMPVPTPVWAAESGGRLYVRSERMSGKVKRLSKDSRVLIAPCTMRGKPLGAPLEGRGSVISPEREHLAEQALAQRYGLGRALFEWVVDRMRVDMCYVEIIPGSWGGPTPTDTSGGGRQVCLGGAHV